MSIHLDPDQHLEPDQIADLQEGLLEPPVAAEAREHLSACQRCQRDLRALDEVSTALAGAAHLEPMPTEVAARLDAALVAAQESAAEDAAHAPGGELAESAAAQVNELPARDNVTELPRPGTRRWWGDHRILQAAAVAVLVLAGGMIAVPVLQHSGTTLQHSGTAERSAADAGAPAAKRMPESSSADGSDGAAPPPHSIARTGTEYRDESLRAQVLATLAAEESTSSRTSDSALSDGRTSQRLAAPGPLAECVAALTTASGTSPSATPVLVDIARFNGSPATIIVLELPAEPDRLGVWVVRPGCRAGDPQVIRHMTVPRR